MGMKNVFIDGNMKTEVYMEQPLEYMKGDLRA